MVCYSVLRESDIHLIGNLRMRITALGDESILARFQYYPGRDWDDERHIKTSEFAYSYRREDDAKMAEAMADYAANTTPGNTWIEREE